MSITCRRFCEGMIEHYNHNPQIRANVMHMDRV